MHTRVWWGNLMEREHLEDPGIEGRITLKLIFRRWDGTVSIELIWLRSGQVAGICECDYEPSGSIKCREFLD